MGWLLGYAKRKKLTYAGAAHISGDLIDQDVVLHVGSGETDFWTNNPPAGGGGVRVTTSDGSTLCTFQAESYDTVGDDGWWHIKVPTLSASADTILYLYYDATTETDGSDKQATWDSNYKMVCHLNGDQTEGAFDDATINNNDGTNSGTTDVASRIDKGRSFNGTSASISVPDSTSLRPATFCVEATFTPSVNFPIGGGVSDIQPIFDRSGNPGGFTFQIDDGTGQLQCWFYTGTWQSGVSTRTTWTAGVTYHVAAVYNGTDIRIYVDNVLESTTAATGTIIYDTTTARIGRYSIAADRYFTGTIDELTVSTARPADWVSARYQSGLGTWLTVGVMEVKSDILLSGSFAAQSGSSGALAVTRPLSGSFAAQSGTSGALALDVGLAGSFAAQSGTSGALTIITPGIVLLAGSFAAQSGTSAALDVIHTLVGSFAAQSGSSGNLSVTGASVLFSTHNFPSAKTVEYMIVDSNGATLQTWTSVGVIEVAGPSKSGYMVGTNVVTYGDKGFIYWRTSDLLNEASESFDLNINATNMRGTDNANTVAPDNAGIAAIQTIITLLQKYVENFKEIKKIGAVNYLIIYDDGEVSGGVEILRKALKDPSANDIADIAVGAMAIEEASSV